MSFGNPEHNKEQGLDTSSPEAKIAEVQAKIAATERGIKLAARLTDPERVQEMENKKAVFEATLAQLKADEQLGDLDFTPPVEKPPKLDNRFDVVKDGTPVIGQEARDADRFDRPRSVNR